MSLVIPPIKSQGIKTKLVPWINDLILQSGVDLQHANWIEPFFGTGVVGFNTPIGGTRIVGDTNPYIIDFYNGIKDKIITPQKIHDYLVREGALLEKAEENGFAHYKLVRNRFNKEHDVLDFLFLSRAGFNGMERFNRNGQWNVPFCKKANRFSQAYITKICNQVLAVQRQFRSHSWELKNISFLETISQAREGDLIYCDPPYFGRYADYYNGWTMEDEEALFMALSNTPAHFILSTWHHNEFRTNEMIKAFWSHFNVETREHFYHNGGKVENRHPMVEALVFNFNRQTPTSIPLKSSQTELIFLD